MSVLRNFERSTKTKASGSSSQPLWTWLCPSLRVQSTAQPQRRREIHHSHYRKRPKLHDLSATQAENAFINALVRASTCRRHFKHTDVPFDQSPLAQRTYRSSRTWDGEGWTPSFGRRKEPTRAQLAAIEEAEALELWSSTSTALFQQGTREEMKGIIDIYGQFESEALQHEPCFVDPILDLAEQNEREIAASVDNSTDLGFGLELAPGINELDGQEAEENEGLEMSEVVPESHSSVIVKRYRRGGSQESRVDLETWSKVERFRLLVRVEDPSEIPQDQLFDAYIDLPHPRASNLSNREIHQLTTALSWIDQRSEVSMMRYLAVLDDLRANGRGIALDQWTTAVHMSAYWKGIATSHTAESAMKMWKQMEVNAGIKADVVTFTILFSISSKAKQFALADMIFREMVEREIKLDRLARLARVFYHGLKGNGEAVRHGYERFIDAGEIVDTQALNCIISSLLNAGEPSNAEHVFHRMKTYHAERLGDTNPPEDWREIRKIRGILRKSTDRWRNNRKAMQSIQNAAPIAPDSRTYKILINHYANEAGNVDRVFELVYEMHEMNLPLTGAIYPAIFKGFFLHGGVRYSSWTSAKLEELWAMFASDMKNRPSQFRTLGASDFSFLAFAQCATSTRCEGIRDLLRSNWHVPKDVEAKWLDIITKKKQGLRWNTKL